MIGHTSKPNSSDSEIGRKRVAGVPRVLIVEDEAIIALDLEKRLIEIGFRVTGRAASGKNALEEIERDLPDVVLMDIRIKGEMDGVQTAEIIRKRYALPVIYLTSHGDDGTLDRALATEPFGYLVKPVSRVGLRVTIMIALFKRKVEIELQDSRRLLSAFLHGLPDAVVTADSSGRVLFLNRAAEEITGWQLHEAAGERLDKVAPIFDGEGHVVLPPLLDKAGMTGTLIRVPRDSVLLTRDGKRVDIAGRLSVTSAGGETVGYIVTLQEISFQKAEGLQLQQERQMLAVGGLAHDVASEFFRLFGLIDEAAKSALGGSNREEIDLIRHVSQLGTGMSQKLLDLREDVETAHAVDVRQTLEGSQAFLRTVCGPALELELVTGVAIGYVVSTGNHFQQLLVNLVMEGQRRLEGQGLLFLGADVHAEAGAFGQEERYVRLFVRAERSGATAEGTFERDVPGLELPIARAIVAAGQGFVRTREASDLMSVVEVFLPWHESARLATRAIRRYSRTVLMVGMPAEVSGRLKRLGSSVLALEASDLEEARWIAELHDGDIDLLIWDEHQNTAEERERAYTRMRVHRQELQVMAISVTEGVTEMELREIEERVKRTLHIDSKTATG